MQSYKSPEVSPQEILKNVYDQKSLNKRRKIESLYLLPPINFIEIKKYEHLVELLDKSGVVWTFMYFQKISTEN